MTDPVPTLRRSLTAVVAGLALMLGACSDDANGVDDQSPTPGGTGGTETTSAGNNPNRGDTRPIDSAIAPDTASGNPPATGGDSGP